MEILVLPSPQLQVLTWNKDAVYVCLYNATIKNQIPNRTREKKNKEKISHSKIVICSRNFTWPLSFGW